MRRRRVTLRSFGYNNFISLDELARKYADDLHPKPQPTENEAAELLKRLEDALKAFEKPEPVTS